MMSRFKKHGASVLWFFGVAVFAAMTYRAVAYYGFDVDFNVNMNDLYIALGAFAMMFINAELKTVIVEFIKRFLPSSTK